MDYLKINNKNELVDELIKIYRNPELFEDCVDQIMYRIDKLPNHGEDYYSEFNFFLLNSLLNHFFNIKKNVYYDFQRAFLKLLEIWLKNGKLTTLDANWFYLRIFLKPSNAIAYKFIKLLISIASQHYEVISFYSYVSVLPNDKLPTKFIELIRCMNFPDRDLFIQAEYDYCHKNYFQALEKYELLSRDCPIIPEFLAHKKYVCASHTSIEKIFRYSKDELKIHQNQYCLEPNIIHKKILLQISEASDILLLNKGIMCEFCGNFISPNAKSCPKCGQPFISS